MFYCENLMINERKLPEKIFRTFLEKRKFSGNCLPSHHFVIGVWYDTTLVCVVVVIWCFTVEVEWCSSWDVGGSADTVVLDDVREWRWRWWRRPSVQAWQVQECWAPSVHHAVVSMLVLATDTDRLARVANKEVGQTPTEETHWAWVS